MISAIPYFPPDLMGQFFKNLQEGDTGTITFSVTRGPAAFTSQLRDHLLGSPYQDYPDDEDMIVTGASEATAPEEIQETAPEPKVIPKKEVKTEAAGAKPERPRVKRATPLGAAERRARLLDLLRATPNQRTTDLAAQADALGLAGKNAYGTLTKDLAALAADGKVQRSADKEKRWSASAEA